VLKGLAAAALGGALTAIGIGGAAAAKGDKVSFCHQNDNGTYDYVTVSQSAAAAHRTHGDVENPNFATDANNCGDCGIVCGGDACNTPVCIGGQCGTSPLTGPECETEDGEAGTCSGGACVAVGTCPSGGACGAQFPSCGGPGCVCVATPDGAVCATPRSCAVVQDCTVDTDCPDGEVCGIGFCCGVSRPNTCALPCSTTSAARATVDDGPRQGQP
jgi:hypothetical protein